MKITLTDATKLAEVTRRITESHDERIEIVLEDESVYTRYPSNMKLLKRIGKGLGKDVVIQKMNTGLETETAPSEVVDEKVQAVVPTAEVDAPSKNKDEEVDDGASSEDQAVPAGKRRGVSPKMVLISFLVLLVFSLIAGSGYVYFYLPRGTVTLFVGERVLERNLVVTVDSSTESGVLGDRIIPGQEVTIEIEETESFDATGTKTIGEKALGTAEIRNFTASDVRVSAGTLLTWQTAGGEDLNFVTQETVVVPEAAETSPDANTRVFEASVVEVTVEAADIGEQYNLPIESQFLVEGYTAKNVRTDFFAVAETPFSGGSTEDVKIVTEQDQLTAQEQLKSQVFANATENLKKQIMGGYEFDENSIDNSTKYVQFSHDASDETEEFDVSIKVVSSVMTYDKTNLRELLQEDVSENIPDGFELSEENVVVKVEEANVVDGNLTLKSKISALVVPVLDEMEIRDALVGAHPADAEAYLRNIDEIEGYDVRLWPSLPDAIRRFPYLADRLEVTVEVKDAE